MNRSRVDRSQIRLTTLTAAIKTTILSTKNTKRRNPTRQNDHVITPNLAMTRIRTTIHHVIITASHVTIPGHVVGRRRRDRIPIIRRTSTATAGAHVINKTHVTRLNHVILSGRVTVIGHMILLTNPRTGNHPGSPAIRNLVMTSRPVGHVIDRPNDIEKRNLGLRLTQRGLRRMLPGCRVTDQAKWSAKSHRFRPSSHRLSHHCRPVSHRCHPAVQPGHRGKYKS